MKSSSIPDWEFFRDLFGFNHHLIEEKVSDLPNHYKNLSPEALYTSYEDLLEIMTGPWARGTWIDLGAGVGQSALMYAYLFPDRISFALEKDEARIQSGLKVREKLNLLNSHLLQADLLSTEIPDGETYFLYFPTGMVLDRILSELRTKKSLKRIIAIESHGDLLPRLAREPWLKVSGSIPLQSPRHYPVALVFERISQSEGLLPHQISFLERFLIIEDENKMKWIGESYNLEWMREDNYQLSIPPRTIQWEQVKEIVTLSELPPRAQFLVKLRRLNDLSFIHQEGLISGSIRKIEVSPSFRVELSSGEWVEWSKIKRITWGDTLCFEALSDYYYLPPVPWVK